MDTFKSITECSAENAPKQSSLARDWWQRKTKSPVSLEDTVLLVIHYNRTVSKIPTLEDTAPQHHLFCQDAVREDHGEVVRILVDKGAKVFQDGQMVDYQNSPLSG